MMIGVGMNRKNIVNIVGVFNDSAPMNSIYNV